MEWVAAGWQEREEQATEGAQHKSVDHNFLGSGFRTMVSVVAGFQNPKTENEGR